MPSGVFIRSAKHNASISKALSGKAHPEERARKNRVAFLGKKHSLHSRQLMSKSHSGEKNHMFGKTHSAAARQQIKANHAHLHGASHPAAYLPDYGRRISAGLMRRSREVVFRTMSASNRTNAMQAASYPERTLFSIVDALFPGHYCMNTRGEALKFGRKRPDIVNIAGQKKVIEFNGRAWHNDAEAAQRVELFQSFGFSTCIVWSEEIKQDVRDELVLKLQRFHESVAQKAV